LPEYLVALAVVFAINLLPAFGPPTWAVLVLFTLNSDLSAPAIVVGGAIAAAAGRLTLAMATRRLRPRLRADRRRNLEAARAAIESDRRLAVGGLGLFALSPIPSAQLFVGAGLLDVRLVPLTLAFFSGRLVSYSLYVGAATAAEASLGEVVEDSLTSPVGIGLQLLMVGALVLLVRVDWTKALAARVARHPSPKPDAIAYPQPHPPAQEGAEHGRRSAGGASPSPDSSRR
jgi:hypothetical protein